jgi:type I restriction enzyme S subunit
MSNKRYKLGEICRLVKGLSPTLKTEPGPYPLVVTAEFRRSAITYQLEGPAVCVPLISSTGHGDAALHRVHYQEGKFALASLLVALLPNDPAVCDAKYLYHLLMAKKDEYLVPLMLGTANVSLKERDIAGVEISLPPLPEQRRIVKIIDSIAQKIQTAKNLCKQAAEEAKAIVGSTYRKIFENSKSWHQLSLNKITTEVGQQIHAGQIEYSNYPYLSLENIEAHTGKILEYLTCQEAGIRGSAVLFGTNDVLYSKLRPYLNKVVTPPFEGCATTELVILRPDTTVVDRNYLAAFLRNPEIVKETVANSAGTKMPRTNIKWFRQLLVSLPPLPEQRRIVAYLDDLQAKINKLKDLQNQTAAELDALLPSILDKAFKGEL